MCQEYPRTIFCLFLLRPGVAELCTSAKLATRRNKTRITPNNSWHVLSVDWPEVAIGKPERQVRQACVTCKLRNLEQFLESTG